MKRGGKYKKYIHLVKKGIEENNTVFIKMGHAFIKQHSIFPNAWIQYTVNKRNMSHMSPKL